MDTKHIDGPRNHSLNPHRSNIPTQKCRLCLSSCETMIELFTEEAILMKINEKLNTFCHLEICEHDIAPRTICFTCLNEVNRFCDFYRRVQDNQKLLSLSYGTSHVEKIINNESDTIELEVVNTTDIVSRSLAFSLGDVEKEMTVKDEFVAENEEVLIIQQDSTTNKIEECEDLNYDCSSSTEEKLEIEEFSNNQDGNIINEADENNIVDFDDENSSEEAKYEENTLEFNENGASPSLKCSVRNRIALDRPIREFFELRCQKCAINFQTFQSTKNHMLRIHNEEFYFVCCNRKLCRRNVILEHIDTHLNPKKFTCDICNQFCKTKITLEIHKKQHIPKEQQPFACGKCGDRFALKSQLKSHMNTHLSNDEKKYICDQCGKAFAFKFVLEKHKKRMHVRQKNYICEICARSFVDKVNLTEHKRVHDTSLPRLECHQCNALLKSKKTLKIHMRLHDPSQFPCEMCTKIFPTKTGLLNHVRYYHMSKQYPCPTCERVFKVALNLKEHMATHTGESLYKCEYCDKTFNAKANRYVHVKKVHPKEWIDKQKLRWRVGSEH